MIGIVAISLLAMSLSGVLGVKANSVNFQVEVVKGDFSGLGGAPVEVWDDATLVTTEFTNSAGDVFFSLEAGKSYEFRAGNASTTALASSVPAPVLVGVILMPTNRYLRVQTDPVDLVTIPGEGWYNVCTSVPLTAPVTVTKDSTLYVFGYWDVDGASQGAGVNSITVHMDACHTATAHYTKVISVNKELTSGNPEVTVGQEVDFVMRVTLHAYEPVTGVTVKDGIGADLVVDNLTGSPDTATWAKAGQGKMGASIVTWPIDSPIICTDYTLDIEVHTGLNAKGKQEYTSPGEKKLNSGPVVYFTYNGTLYTLQGPSVKVTAVLP
jgi:hypothetical protein